MKIAEVITGRKNNIKIVADEELINNIVENIERYCDMAVKSGIPLNSLYNLDETQHKQLTLLVDIMRKEGEINEAIVYALANSTALLSSIIEKVDCKLVAYIQLLFWADLYDSSLIKIIESIDIKEYELTQTACNSGVLKYRSAAEFVTKNVSYLDNRQKRNIINRYSESGSAEHKILVAVCHTKDSVRNGYYVMLVICWMLCAAACSFTIIPEYDGYVDIIAVVTAFAMSVILWKDVMGR